MKHCSLTNWKADIYPDIRFILYQLMNTVSRCMNQTLKQEVLILFHLLQVIFVLRENVSHTFILRFVSE